MTDNSRKYGRSQLTVSARCIEVDYLGTVLSKWGMKDFVRLVFRAETEIGDAHHFQRTYEWPLDADNELSQHLQSWLGRRLSKNERAGAFDLKRMEGEDCRLELRQGLDERGRKCLKIARILSPTLSLLEEKQGGVQ